MHSFDCGEITVLDRIAFNYYPIVKEYMPEGELFDQVVKESEKETMISEVTSKPRFYHIWITSPRGAFNAMRWKPDHRWLDK